MRIGMMLRTLDEKGGIATYTRYLLEEMLALDRRNEYVLFYRTPAHVGRFSRYPNVKERVIRGSHKAYWDQVAIPLACWREKVDLVFHPKFTAPLLAPCKAIMVVHGADWLMPDQAVFYPKWNVRYNRFFLPLYFRKCEVVISVSQLTTDNFYATLKLPPGKVRTVYFGPAKHFRRVEDPAALDRVKRKYSLPDRFVLTLSGYDRGRRKNIDGIIHAYEIFHGKTDHKLVIGGKDCYKFKADYGVPENGYGKDIVFPGWIEQEDLPAFYTLADLYLYPSNLEAFPIPITEAMACGTPIVTSNVNGLVEIAGEAALFVDPEKPAEIADAMVKVLGDPALRQQLRAKGLARSQDFSWPKCARETLAIIEESGAREA
jgi:glycosyltransferase involved in cell wall biosynthesis